MSDPRRQAGATYAAADTLGLKNPIVIGHSWGGAVATAYACSMAPNLPRLGTGGTALSWRGGQLV